MKPLTRQSPPNEHRCLTLLLGCLFIAVVLILVSHAKADPDLWGHVRFGQDILASGSIPRQPSYSFTADESWVNHEWLAEVVMAAAYRAGTPGLLVLLGMVAASAFAMIASAIRRAGVDGPAAVGLLAVAVLGASFQLMTIRPQFFSVLLLAALLLLLTLAEQRRRVLLAVPFLLALWANLHGGWIVGLAVLGLWVAGAAWRQVLPWWQAASTVAAAAAGTLLNPYGYGLWAFLLKTVRVGRADIEEWQAIWESPLHLLPWILTAIVLAWGCARLGRDAWRTLPALVLAALSFKVARLEGLFALATAVLAAPAFRGVGQRFRLAALPSRKEVLSIAALCAIGLGAALVAASRTATCLPLMSEREFGTPEPEAVLFMSANALSGRMVTWFDYGQYAIWHLAPEVQVSYDGRRETVYSERVRHAHQQFYAGDAAYARRIQGDYVWIPRTLPVVRRLLDEGWVAIFEGPRSVVLAAKSNPGVTRHSAFTGPRCFPGP